MTVERLIKKLQKMPQDATVTVYNDKMYVDGEYEVSYVETYDCKTVAIVTDYKHKVGGEE